jgi:hypothetical protein
MLLIGGVQSLGAQDDKRFVEFQGRGSTETYDLSTVKMLQPGRFAIVSTSIDDPDVMKLKLKVLDTLQAYCKQPNGKYPAPTDLFMLGPPDMEIESIEVQTVSSLVKGRNASVKFVFWHYPYDRLALHTVGAKVAPMGGDIKCTDDEENYFARRTEIMNGIRTKELFDCKRGLMGNFHDDDDDDPFTHFVHPQTYGHRVYGEICLRVTHETPYSPE